MSTFSDANIRIVTDAELPHSADKIGKFYVISSRGPERLDDEYCKTHKCGFVGPNGWQAEPHYFESARDALGFYSKASTLSYPGPEVRNSVIQIPGGARPETEDEFCKRIFGSDHA